MIRQLGLDRQWGLRILCALALLLVGLAHKPPVLESGPIPASEITAYTLPDGTVPTLCLASEDGKAKHGHHDVGALCEACRLAAATILPAPTDTAGLPLLREIGLIGAFGNDSSERPSSSPAFLATGPPLSDLA